MTRHRSGEALVFSVATAAAARARARRRVRAPRAGPRPRPARAGRGDRGRRRQSRGVLAFPSLRPGLRAALAFAFGGLALVNGDAARAAHRGARCGRRRRDRRARRRRGPRARSGWPSRSRGATAARARQPAPALDARVLLVPAGLMTLLFVLGPIGVGIVATHKWREPVGDPPSAAYARRPLRGHRRARARRLVPAVAQRRGGGRGARRQQRPQGLASPTREMLARARLRRAALRRPRARRERRHARTTTAGTGPRTSPARSSSSSSAADVDPGRIGAIGLSTGADVLIQVAAERTRPGRRGRATAPPPARSRTGTASAASSSARCPAG